MCTTCALGANKNVGSRNTRLFLFFAIPPPLWCSNFFLHLRLYGNPSARSSLATTLQATHSVPQLDDDLGVEGQSRRQLQNRHDRDCKRRSGEISNGTEKETLWIQPMDILWTYCSIRTVACLDRRTRWYSTFGNFEMQGRTALL